MKNPDSGSGKNYSKSGIRGIKKVRIRIPDPDPPLKKPCVFYFKNCCKFFLNLLGSSCAGLVQSEIQLSLHGGEAGLAKLQGC
jgi:hypothetical protein